MKIEDYTVISSVKCKNCETDLYYLGETAEEAWYWCPECGAIHNFSGDEVYKIPDRKRT